MNVVGHHYKRVELESLVPIPKFKSFDHHLGALRHGKKERSGACFVENSVHRHEGLSLAIDRGEGSFILEGVHASAR
jgi:hypothetical protein